MTPSRGLVLAAGALSGLALAASFGPVAVPGLAWAAVVPFFVALGAAPRGRDAAAAGALLSACLHAPQCWWMVTVMRVHGEVPWPVALGMYAFGVVTVMPYGALVGAGTAAVARRHGALSLLAAPWIWALVDVVRARLALGHPWLIPGMAVGASEAGVADVLGVHGLTAAVLLMNAAVAAVVLGLAGRRIADAPRRALAVAGAAGALATAALVYGRLSAEAHAAPWSWSVAAETGEDGRVEVPELPEADGAPESAGSPEPVRRVRVALMQGAQPQQVKVRSSAQDDLDLARMQLRLTDVALAGGAEIVAWAESSHPDTTASFPYLLPAVRERLAEASRRVDRPEVVVGALVEEIPEGGGDRRRVVTNSALLLGVPGVLGRYDKRRLVPFGEYLPAKAIFGWFPQIVRNVGTFDEGTSDEPLRGAHGALGAFVCYEVVLPQRVRAIAARGADVLVNLTNDGWYHGTWMPEQHLRFAVMRAIETRRFVLRAANSGISAIVAPDGRVVGRLEEGRRGVLLGVVAPRPEPTLYVRWGDAPVALLGLVAAGWCAACAVRSERERRADEVRRAREALAAQVAALAARRAEEQAAAQARDAVAAAPDAPPVRDSAGDNPPEGTGPGETETT